MLWVLKRTRWSRIVFLPEVLNFSSELDQVNPGLGVHSLEKGTGITLVRQVWRKACSFLRTLAGSVFRERIGTNPGSASLEFRERSIPFSKL